TSDGRTERIWSIALPFGAAPEAESTLAFYHITGRIGPSAGWTPGRWRRPAAGGASRGRAARTTLG
ncbi:MAG: hypothetical protein LBD77_11185, partial [Bifidobacteriaceae bacterium]|nr:hypothetical protein [Bifidobacteriaceae bacterium]